MIYVDTRIKMCFYISYTELPYKLISQGILLLKTFLVFEFKLLPLVIEH